jgi:hypothetical protein
VESYDVLKVLSNRDSVGLFNEVSNRGSIDGETLMSLKGLTKKQYYTRILRLAECGLIRRKSGKYSLTSFGRVIHDCKLKIDNAIDEYYSLKAIDSFNDSREINTLQKKKPIETIVRDSTIRTLLID